MPKITKYPRLRTKVYKTKDGKAHVYYVYDMRKEGKPDIRLGNDHAKALVQWEELHNKRPLTIGRLEEAFAHWKERELPKYSGDTLSGYTKNLKTIWPVFGQMVWEEVDLPTLRQYLDLRTGKTQANREMSLLRLIWGKARLWGMTRCPWPAEGIKGWKNEENARTFEVTVELFRAVYAQADQVLRDGMDTASATGLRLRDVIAVELPKNGLIKHIANKTKKTKGAIEFAVAESPVLTSIVERRLKMNSLCRNLICLPDGRPVTSRMLSRRWEDARDAAAYRAEVSGDEELAKLIRSMYLRDMRSFAANLADDITEASKLLDHSNVSVTRKHYRTRATRLKAVR
ncbi:integrase [Comamonas antarctica]|uniref:Integrase n=1 Tax=Comamonas antarctica TaxID=2743470 RepID=A0A6N1WYT4_9BURK|nr:integrase [Comamonas antarctica]QKV52359.1 integrase [Comamonas antarctica]